MFCVFLTLTRKRFHFFQAARTTRGGAHRTHIGASQPSHSPTPPLGRPHIPSWPAPAQRDRSHPAWARHARLAAAPRQDRRAGRAGHWPGRAWVDAHRDPPNVPTERAHVLGGRPHTPCDRRARETRSDTRFCAPIAPSGCCGAQRAAATRQPSHADARRCAARPLLACRAAIVAAPRMPPPGAAAHRAQARPSDAPPSRNRRMLRPSTKQATPKPRPVSERETGSAGCARARGRRAHGSKLWALAHLDAKRRSTSRGTQGGKCHPGAVQRAASRDP